MADLLDELERRYPHRVQRGKIVKAVLAAALALAVGITLNWLLWHFHLNPVHIRDVDW